MANQKKREKLPRFTSPRGVFRFPSLVKPDFGTKEYPKPDGIYKTGVILTKNNPAVQEFIAKLQPLHDAALESAAEEFADLKVDTRKKLEAKGITGPVPQPFFTDQYDKETEEPTGNIQMSFTKKASGKRKDETRWTARPPFLFDARGNPVKSKSIAIWGGSEGKVTFDVRPYFIPGNALAGISLILVAAQIIKLVSEGTATAEDMGFEAEEDGFEFNADDFEEGPAFEGGSNSDGDGEAASDEDDDF